MKPTNIYHSFQDTVHSKNKKEHCRIKFRNRYRQLQKGEKGIEQLIGVAQNAVLQKQFPKIKL